MAARLLHSLTEENPELQKHIGCMTGIFHMFDSQHIITSARRSRFPHGNSHFHSLDRESNNTHGRSASAEKYSVSHKNNQEKQRISNESSRPSVSSTSRSSSFSSLDCNRATQLEPASYDRIIFPETPSRDPSMSLQNSSPPQSSRQSRDIRDLVKDSMYREVHALSTKAKTTAFESSDPDTKYKDSLRPRSKTSSELKEPPWYVHEPRELFRSVSFHAKEGSSFSLPRDAPRFSYDGREVNRAPFDVSKSTLKLNDGPRLSLDGRESFLKAMQNDSNFELDGRVQKSQHITGHQTRPPSVVAKLMGLETLPDSIPSSNDEDFVNIISKSSAETDRTSIQTSSSSRKEPSSPRSSVKPMSRFPIEAAPWKQIDSTKSTKKPGSRAIRAQAKGSTTFPSVYSEIEKRLNDLEFTQSGKDLRALKQILEAMQSKGLLKTEKEVRSSNLEKHSSPGNQEASSVNNNQKQVLDSTKRRTRHYESPIVIMKPAKLVGKSGRPATKDSSSKGRQLDNAAVNYVNTKNDRTPKTTKTSSKLPQMAQESNAGSGKSSGSISPRMQQKKLELERRSRPPTPPDPSYSRRQSNKQQTESNNNSPGGRRRDKNQRRVNQPSEVNVESRYMNHHENESSAQSNESITRSSKKTPHLMLSDLVDKKSTRVMSEEESGVVPTEYSSPVSVLDKSVCGDDSPSPVKYVGKTLKVEVSVDKEMDSTMVQTNPPDNYVPISTEPDSTSEISRKKLQNIENLVQKLRRLNSTHDEARTDYIASLCENTNPDHRYISEILLASGLLLRELDSSLTNFQFHPSGHPINSELFLVLEQTKASTLLSEVCNSTEKTTCLMMEGRSHRKLIFDTVNEILATKLGSGGPFSETRPVKVCRRAMNAQKLLRELCSEIELLQVKNPKCGLDDDAWKDILCEDVMHESGNWLNFEDEMSGAVLDIERSIFKDLVNEIVIGESAGLKTETGKRRLFVK